MQAGVLAGYPVVDCKVTLYDGSYHEVDSSEMAFKIAGSMAFKEAMRKADPVILEPIMKVNCKHPRGVHGRRYRRPELPPWSDSEVWRPYSVPRRSALWFLCLRCLVTATDLRCKTQGRGNYTMEPHSYVEVPKIIADKIISERTKNN